VPAFLDAVQVVGGGGTVLDPEVVSQILVRSHRRSALDELTTREREVLQLLAEGKSNKEVAAVLNLSLYTVETHRGNILQKLNLHSGADLILYAIRKGVVG
jgi:DNA-binding NarL/FixJ family response regulator